MKTRPGVHEFLGGRKPKGKTEAFTGPVVLRFPPSAYRVVQADELEQWQQEIKDQLCLVFDLGEASVGTVTYSERGGSGAAYRSDSDIESGSDLTVENERPGGLRAWDAKPVVLHFPPDLYEVVEPGDQLREWEDDLSRRFDIEVHAGPAASATISWCYDPPWHYQCDSDCQ